MSYRIILLFVIILGSALILPAMTSSSTDIMGPSNATIQLEGTITSVVYSQRKVEITVMTSDGMEIYTVILGPIKLYRGIVFKEGIEVEIEGWLRNGEIIPTTVKISDLTIEIRYKNKNGEIEKVQLRECKDQKCRIIIRRNTKEKCETCAMNRDKTGTTHDQGKQSSSDEGENTGCGSSSNQENHENQDHGGSNDNGDNDHAGDHPGKDHGGR
ncbi:MAG: hypothetical protein J7L28_03885 [Thermotogae bacterium]|nr:hypothetical protein [Thermotogota bacterium]